MLATVGDMKLTGVGAILSITGILDLSLCGLYFIMVKGPRLICILQIGAVMKVEPPK